MLKYDNIISALSDDQKIRLLTNISCFNKKEFNNLGVPRIQMARLADCTGDKSPDPVAAARSWNTDLIKAIAYDRITDLMNSGANLIELPPSKPMANPYLGGISEDVCLTKTVSNAYMDAIQENGFLPLMSGFEITNAEAKWLDKDPDHRTVYEQIVEPYYSAVGTRPNVGLLHSLSEYSDSKYGELNKSLINSVQNGDPGNFVLLKKVSPDDTVGKISQGFICLEGSYDRLSAAYNLYNKLSNDINHGKATVTDLESEISSGKAISRDAIDRSLDHLLDFAFLCNQGAMPQSGLQHDELMMAAARESVVLLKNEKKILPIKSKKKKNKICVIGDVFGIMSRSGQPTDPFHLFHKNQFEYKFIQGYDFSRDREQYDTLSLQSQTFDADYVILFLGTDKAREDKIPKNHKLTIPASQLALVDKLSIVGKKTIAVVSSNYSLDVSFADKLSALLLVPSNTMYALHSAIEVILGEICPSGRLNSTIYHNTEETLSKLRMYRNNQMPRVGPFIGYRYYDTIDTFSGYPFGHGLSYTKFAYSGLNVNHGKVEVTVKNTGKMAGAEVVQIYIGKSDSFVIRPKKELVAFAKVTLAPKEKKTLCFDLKPPQVYDKLSNKLVTESGNYTVYAASSVTDVKLEKKISIHGEYIEKDNEKRSDFLQSESNIISDKYILEANYKHMKRSARNIAFGILLILLALVLRIYCAFSKINDTVFNAISIVLALTAICLFVFDLFDRKKIHDKERAAIDNANQEIFADAQQIPVLTSENMFVTEFDTENDEAEKAAVIAAETVSDIFKYINKDLTFEAACNEFSTFAKDRGCVMSSETVKCLFSAFAASRLIITKNMKTEDFGRLITIISAYFGTDPFYDAVNAGFASEDYLLFRVNEMGVRTPRATLGAIECAARNQNNVYVVSLDQVEMSNISSYFVPFARYAANPLSAGKFSAYNYQARKTSYLITPNVWFILNLKEGEKITAFPDYIADTATVTDIRFEAQTPSEIPFVAQNFKFPQMDYLLEKAQSQYAIPEEDWKKVDKLEEYAESCANYNISNKLLTSVERYASVYLACGGEKTEVLDRSVAAKLLPSIITAIKGRIPSDKDDLTETISKIFGEENSSICHRTVLDCGPDVK